MRVFERGPQRFGPSWPGTAAAEVGVVLVIHQREDRGLSSPRERERRGDVTHGLIREAQRTRLALLTLSHPEDLVRHIPVSVAGLNARGAGTGQRFAARPCATASANAFLRPLRLQA